jgi:hypothetical protein
MPSLCRFATSAGLALALAAFACMWAWAEAAMTGDQPRTVEAAPTAQANAPAKVIVGAYINDIQELDFKTNNYAIDLYVWFRWKGGDANPSKTMDS